MKCPYTCDVEDVQQNVYERDTSGDVTMHQYKAITKRNYIDCLESECGAWQDGKCNYKGE